MYKEHVNEYLQEINDIDIEPLDHGDIIFKFSLFDFKSGQTVIFRDHLR